jgi:hypothetical protein
VTAEAWELPPVRPLHPSPGHQMDPVDIVGRDRDIEAIWELLGRSRAMLLLNEPRRIGKTSVLVRLCHEPPFPWLCVCQSFQGVKSTLGLVELALNGIQRHQSLSSRARSAARAFLGNAKARTRIQGVEFELARPFQADPIAAFERVLHDVAEALGDRRLLLAWDEVPDMITAIADHEGDLAATHALALLRRFRESKGADSIRWLLTGSVGFHHVVRRLGRDDLLNDLENVDLGPLDPTWTRWLSHCLLLGAGVDNPSDAVVHELADASGGIAFLVHLAAKEVRDRRQTALAPGDISQLLDHALGDLDRGQQMTAFLTRLNRHYGDDADLAAWLLDQLANGSHTRSELHALTPPKNIEIHSDEHLRTILDWLRSDHYLDALVVKDERRYEWRYPPLRRVWVLRRL